MVGSEVSGRSIARLLEDAGNEARRRTVALRGEAERLDGRVRSLLQRRSERIEQLAAHYLPELSAASLEESLPEVRQRVADVLDRKQDRQQQLQDDWDRALDERHRLQLEMDEVAERLDELTARRADLETDLTKRLEADDEFGRLTGLALKSEQELQSNEQRVAESRQDASEKLPEYERSSLFKYLYDRKFGTPDYKSKGVTRQLDRWVAKLVNFADNRKSYDFLRVTPELMAAEVARRRDDFSNLMQRIEGIEDAASDEIGLTDVLHEGEEFSNRRDTLVDSLADHTKRRERIEAEIHQLAEPGNQFHREGIVRLREYFSSLREAALLAKAKKTPEFADDQLTSEIADLAAQVESIRDDAAASQQRLDRWHERLAGLDYVVQQFRRRDFESGRSRFSSRIDYDHEIDQYLEGRISKKDLWETLRKSQRFAAPDYGDGMWEGFGDVIDSDVSHVLVNVLMHAASAALEHSARRSVTRRGPKRRTHRKKSGRPRIHRGRRGGFTTGGGF